jgi:transcriptional regulator with XRE-family HTH domain
MNPDSIGAIAARLKATREALGYSSQKEFADRAGVTTTAYNNWERGKKRPDIESAIRLCTEYALTLDWIYRGDATGLPHGVAVKVLDPRRQRGGS